MAEKRNRRKLGHRVQVIWGQGYAMKRLVRDLYEALADLKANPGSITALQSANRAMQAYEQEIGILREYAKTHIKKKRKARRKIIPILSQVSFKTLPYNQDKRLS